MARISFILFMLLSGLFAGCDNERTETDVIHEAIISIYRQGRLEGSFVDNGNGELAFSSDDGSVKGIIKINGQGGASFRVTETSGESPFSVGEEFEFLFAE